MHYSVNITCFKLPVRTKSSYEREIRKSKSQFENLALIPRKLCHTSLPKIHENRVATRVGDVYTRGDTPRIHTRPKVKLNMLYKSTIEVLKITAI